MLRDRLLTAAVGVPLLLAALYIGGWPYAIVFAVAAAAAVAEIWRLLGLGRMRGGAGVACALLAMGVYAAAGSGRFLAPVLTAGLLLLGFRQVWLYPDGHVGDTGAILLGAVYAGLTLGHFPALRQLPGGLHLTLLVFLLTWAFDSVAYFAGIRFGKHRLAPRLSPGKSWEGAVAGGTAAILLAAAPLTWWPEPLGLRLAVAATVIVAGQLGDLFESSLKRYAQVKDSGAILPGHGGVLDRFDSLMFVVPAVYYLVRLWPSGVVS